MIIDISKKQWFVITAIFFVGCFFVGVTQVFADTLSFNSSADSYLQSGSPNINNGSETVMDLTNTRDGVVRFDLSAIPSGSTITSATLTLVVTAVGSASSIKNYGSHRILVDWTESTVTWNTPGSTAGTHFASSPTETIAVSTTGSYSWNVASDVTNFVNGSATNYGWRIIWSSNTSGTNKQVDFGTKENSTVSNRPVLSVTYTPPVPADTTAPSAVSNLAASSPSNSAITLSWTSPGDDSSSGTATSYDIRYSTSNITDGNWSSATQVSEEPTPLVAGTSQSKTVTGLSPSTTYFFAIKTSDEVPNISAISNVPSLATTATPDTTAPAAITNLALSSPSNSAMTVSWTASGDDGSTGIATSYDLRYSTSAITSDNFSSATQVSGEPTPLVAGTSQSMTVTGLSPSTTYFFAIKTSDEAPNESSLSNVPSLSTLAESSLTIPSAGGGGSAPTSVVISGKSFPGSKIELLRKSIQDEIYRNTPEVISTVLADGTFSIRSRALLGGEYFFALRAEDKDGRKTGVITFSMNLLSIDRFEAKDIFMPPTIGVEKAVVVKGQEIKIMGYALPNGKIELEIDGIIKMVATSTKDGLWALAISTAQLSLSEHQVKARQIDQDGRKSDFSPSIAFRISSLTFPKADFNGDNAVNITDWSVFLFRWGSKDEKLRSKIDMDGNGKIDITDFSLFLSAMKI